MRGAVMPRAHFQTVRRQLPRDLGLEEHSQRNTTATDKDGAPWYLSEVTISGDNGGEYVTFLAESPLSGPVVEMPGTDLIGAVLALRKGVHRPVTKSRMADWEDEVGAVAELPRLASSVERVSYAFLTKIIAS
jgi:hypothetical protein